MKYMAGVKCIICKKIITNKNIERFENGWYVITIRNKKRNYVRRTYSSHFICDKCYERYFA